jgi:DEAD/DEAH box helicase domain-containing protein
MHEELLNQGYETVAHCECVDGCPSCVGPIGKEGSGGKEETRAIFEALIKNE